MKLEGWATLILKFSNNGDGWCCPHVAADRIRWPASSLAPARPGPADETLVSVVYFSACLLDCLFSSLLDTLCVCVCVGVNFGMVMFWYVFLTWVSGRALVGTFNRIMTFSKLHSLLNDSCHEWRRLFVDAFTFWHLFIYLFSLFQISLLLLVLIYSFF